MILTLAITCKREKGGFPPKLKYNIKYHKDSILDNFCFLYFVFSNESFTLIPVYVVGHQFNATAAVVQWIL